MSQVNEFFTTLSGLLWGWPMIILLLGTLIVGHAYLSDFSVAHSAVLSVDSHQVVGEA